VEETGEKTLKLLLPGGYAVQQKMSNVATVAHMCVCVCTYRRRQRKRFTKQHYLTVYNLKVTLEIETLSERSGLRV
jgi:hypothetical protein